MGKGSVALLEVTNTFLDFSMVEDGRKELSDCSRSTERALENAAMIRGLAQGLNLSLGDSGKSEELDGTAIFVTIPQDVEMTKDDVKVKRYGRGKKTKWCADVVLYIIMLLSENGVIEERTHVYAG